ncbi:MAG: hypothetical protein U0412_01260 [Nitrospira sp.]
MPRFNRTIVHIFSWAIPLMLGMAVLPNSLRAEEVEFSKGRFVTYDKPEGFKAVVAHDPDDQFQPTLKFSHFSPSGIKDFGFKIDIHPADPGMLRQDEFAAELMSDLCGRLDAGSVEGTVPIRKRQGDNDVWYCYATDAKLQKASVLPPGSYRIISVAFSRYEGYGFTAIAYSQSVSDSLYRDFLNTMANLSVRESIPRR